LSAPTEPTHNPIGISAPSAPLSSPVARPPVLPTPRPSYEAPKQPEVKAVPPIAPTNKGQRAGWLSDLLDRASQDDGKPDTTSAAVEPETPQNVTKAIVEPTPKVETVREPIAALLADIAHLVDERSAALLWSNYLKGEPVTFSPALYTTQGQQRYTELTQQIAQDQRFRSSVDAYTTKFENVLRDLTTTDTEGSITRSILGSAEGRVYTMLAHISQRFA